MEFWLATTEHLTDRLWFKDEEDFKAGMNIPPILASTMPVNILSFILMSNHVHFVLSCTETDARVFINRFKKMYSQRYRKKYGAGALLRNNDIDIRELSLDDQALERGIAYVQMNSVAANICLTSTEYPWGTGNAFFRAHQPQGFLVGKMSARSLRRCIHSAISLPESYRINGDGFVEPSSYVQVRFVESLFQTPKRMNYFLQNSSKARRVHEAESPSFDDQTVLSGLKSLCVSLFRERSLSNLSEIQQAEVLKQIRYRFSADPGQIARVAGLSYENVCRLLDSY